MSTSNHRQFLDRLVSNIFGGRIFRHRWVRWPLAAFLTALAVHSVTSGAAVEGQDDSVAIPVILFLFALFLVLMPLLPVADGWADDDQRD